MAGVVDRPAARSPWRSVALPAEHGGWGLTLEPGVLGLLVAPSVGGLCIALGAMVAFLARTPLKTVVVDRRRGRVLERTRLAQRVAAGELAVIAVLAAGALLWAEPGFWVPGIAALPLLAVEGWFDVRSRGRRLVPELAGAIGVCSVAAMVVLAGGGDGRLAAGVWLVLAARAATSIPHVRAQIARLHRRASQARAATAGDLAAVALAAVAVALDHSLAAGAAAVLVIIALQRLAGSRPVPRPVVLGMRQMAMGCAVVIVTAIGVLATAS
jgi:YwiC-like protein